MSIVGGVALDQVGGLDPLVDSCEEFLALGELLGTLVVFTILGAVGNEGFVLCIGHLGELEGLAASSEGCNGEKGTHFVCFLLFLAIRFLDLDLFLI